MDIMDSTDTPTGGLDQSSSSSAALPLSVDQRDAFASPTNRSTYGGQQPTSSSSFFSSGSSAMDRMDAVAPRIDENAPNALPTSTDDIMMPHVEFASHPSLTDSSASISTSDSTPPPTAQEVKDKANSAMESAKVKASAAMDAAKDKAGDARDKAADMSESAKVKAADMKENAKAAASDLSAKVGDTADSVKDKLEEGMEKMKVGGQHLLDSVKSSLHSAERTVEDKYEQTKESLASKTDAPRPTAPTVRSTDRTESTDTHPDASSMRDVHLHPGLNALPSHGNENPPEKTGAVFMSENHQRALRAGDEAHARATAEPKDVSAQSGNGMSGMIKGMHDKLEDGVAVVKESVDGFMERNVRSDNDEHLSAANSKDIPSLIDNSNTHNVNQVRAKMHPSQERSHDLDDLDDLEAA